MNTHKIRDIIESDNNIVITKGTTLDIDNLENLYNNLNDHLAEHINYPGWIKGLYPVRETAISGVADETLFVVKIDNALAGSVILNHEPEGAYAQATWGINASYQDILVIHTLAIHPSFLNRGIGTRLMDFIKKYALEKGMRAIRLDVSIDNSPAIALYEKSGYSYIGTVDLGLNIPHLKWFKLYELILEPSKSALQ